MAYDDDFDEEELYNSKKAKARPQVEVVRSRDIDNRLLMGASDNFDIGSDTISDI